MSKRAIKKILLPLQLAITAALLPLYALALTYAQTNSNSFFAAQALNDKCDSNSLASMLSGLMSNQVSKVVLLSFALIFDLVLVGMTTAQLAGLVKRQEPDKKERESQKSKSNSQLWINLTFWLSLVLCLVFSQTATLLSAIGLNRFIARSKACFVLPSTNLAVSDYLKYLNSLNGPLLAVAALTWLLAIGRVLSAIDCRCCWNLQTQQVDLARMDQQRADKPKRKQRMARVEVHYRAEQELQDCSEGAMQPEREKQQGTVRGLSQLREQGEWNSYSGGTRVEKLPVKQRRGESRSNISGMRSLRQALR